MGRLSKQCHSVRERPPQVEKKSQRVKKKKNAKIPAKGELAKAAEPPVVICWYGGKRPWPVKKKKRRKKSFIKKSNHGTWIKPPESPAVTFCVVPHLRKKKKKRKSGREKRGEMETNQRKIRPVDEGVERIAPKGLARSRKKKKKKRTPLPGGKGPVATQKRG